MLALGSEEACISSKMTPAGTGFFRSKSAKASENPGSKRAGSLIAAMRRKRLRDTPHLPFRNLPRPGTSEPLEKPALENLPHSPAWHFPEPVVERLEEGSTTPTSQPSREFAFETSFPFEILWAKPSAAFHGCGATAGEAASFRLCSSSSACRCRLYVSISLRAGSCSPSRV